jgi:predicted DNA-binding transcriptional regulator AlpA
MSSSTKAAARLLRPRAVAAKLSVTLRWVHRAVKIVPGFPQPIHLTDGVSVFDEREIDAFIEARRLASGERRGATRASAETAAQCERRAA